MRPAQVTLSLVKRIEKCANGFEDAVQTSGQRFVGYAYTKKAK